MKNEKPHETWHQNMRYKESEKEKEDDNDAKQKHSKWLYLTFLQNIDKHAKIHADCYEEIEQMTRLKLKKEDEDFVTENIEKIFVQFGEKLIKEMLIKNS